jgi:hypothetical protein
MLAPSFSDSASEAVGFESCWRGEISTKVGQAQTDPLEQAHQRTQHPKLKDMEMVTDPVEMIGAVPMVRSGFQKLKELDAFLEQCTPMLEAQLHRNLNTRAFEGHEVSWDEQYDQVSCLHALKHKGTRPASSPEGCTAVVWNAPGTVVAAAYGALDRNDWQRTPSMLCTWSVFRRSLDPSKADVALELSDCLTCLAFHPEDPALLAGGAYNGDVLLWRLGEKGDPLVGRSMLTNFTHHEPVQQLQWTRDPQRGKASGGYVLVSVAADGKMLVWSPSDGLKAPVGGFHLLSTNGRGGGGGGGGGGGQPKEGKGMLEGASGLSFNAEDPTTFVVALEAGQLLKGSLLAHELRTVQSILREHAELPWSASAAALLTRVPGAQYHRLKSKVWNSRADPHSRASALSVLAC